MKKIILLVISLLLVTGCAVKYNVVINEDLTLTEEAKLTGTSSFFDNYYKTTKTNVLKSMIDIYKDILDENKYTYELKEDTIPYVLVNKKYDNVSEYTNNSILFNGYFDEVKYTEDGNIKRIETMGYMPNDPDNPDRFNIKELEISITCPYKVTNNNAKNYNKETNTFYYELNSESDKILLEYDVSKKFDPNGNNLLIIIIGLVIIVGLWTTVVMLDKKEKKK